GWVLLIDHGEKVLEATHRVGENIRPKRDAHADQALPFGAGKRNTPDPIARAQKVVGRLPQIIGRGAPHGHVEVWQKWFKVGEPKPEAAALLGVRSGIGRNALANSACAPSRVNQPAACERDTALTHAGMNPVAGCCSPDLAVVHTTR